jgi:hypothetical protein
MSKNLMNANKSYANKNDINKRETNRSNIFVELRDYMFTSKNIDRYTKHIINFQIQKNETFIKPKSCLKNIEQSKNSDEENINKKVDNKNFDNKNIENNTKPALKNNIKEKKYEKQNMYKPRQKDSLFWCFYILKYGFSNYEMEINNQYFVVEKNEKFKYIELLRKNKDILKLHKIKPLTQLEDDLANKDKISPKTFFALCALENINVLLVDKRKVYELLCVDIDSLNPINIIHRNSEKHEHLIELDTTKEIIDKYRETYYKLTSFDSTLKSMSSYKLEELMDLCKKLNINIEQKNKDNESSKKKITKKDVYELLVLNY